MAEVIVLCNEYIKLAILYPPNILGQSSNNIKTIRIHIHRLLHIDLQKDYGINIRKQL